jgi:raffinose/stachyose/melibiose transport system substrate-binding protein
MLSLKTKRSILAVAAGVSAVALALTGCSSGGGTGTGASATSKQTISFLIDNSDANVKLAKGLIADYAKIAPKVTVKLETRPAGSDGDNLIKTRLSTGTMNDVFFYNSGSLFQALAPEKNLVDLTNQPFVANTDPGFKTVVTSNNKVYGAPAGTAMGGAILYNKKVYADLGLTVPKTWDDFIANSQKIKAAGKIPIIQTYKDTWTSQLFVLGDFANVTAAEPNWAKDYTANKAKYATDPIAAAGFNHLEQVHSLGLLNKDFGSATFDQGLKMLATGQGAQYPMLTFAVSTIIANYPDNAKDIGVFAIPGTDASKNILTTWEPAAVYIPKTTKHLAAAEGFVNFIASTKGCDSQTKSSGITGPYLVKGCDLPADVPTYVADMLPYFQAAGGTSPALEFVSPIKGPSLEQITVAVGSGITPAAKGAAQYDNDVKKQAQQLGISGW